MPDILSMLDALSMPDIRSISRARYIGNWGVFLSKKVYCVQGSVFAATGLTYNDTVEAFFGAAFALFWSVYRVNVVLEL